MDGEYAIVLDDQNADFREVELEVFRRAGEVWDDLFYLDDQGYPDEGSTHGGDGWMLGFDGHHYSWIYGRERPGTVVTLAFGDKTFTVSADSDGWWFRVVHDDDATSRLRRLS